MWWLTTYIAIVIPILVAVIVSLSKRLGQLEIQIELLKTTKQDSEDYIKTKKIFKEYN